MRRALTFLIDMDQSIRFLAFLCILSYLIMFACRTLVSLLCKTTIVIVWSRNNILLTYAGVQFYRPKAISTLYSYLMFVAVVKILGEC